MRSVPLHSFNRCGANPRSNFFKKQLAMNLSLMYLYHSLNAQKQIESFKYIGSLSNQLENDESKKLDARCC